MKNKLLQFALILIIINTSNAQSFIMGSLTVFEKEIGNSLKSPFKIPRFNSRKIKGLLYSSVVPGSGQIYLGHKTKGALFAVGFFTSLVGAVVSQNNFIGNKERIESLQFEYLNADRYTLADYYWKQMVNVHNEQRTHEKARNIFTIATAIVWTVNLIDYVFLTEDKGPIEFSLKNNFYSHLFPIASIQIPIN